MARPSEIVINDRKMRVLQGDLTEVEADALVNAANNQLWMGGGVAGALKRKGGKIVETDAMRQGPIPIGEAVAGAAGDLDAKFVIHAAGMGTDLRTDAVKIKAATHNALLRAHERGLRSIAFPAIGTGVGGFPVQTVARVMLETAAAFLKNQQDSSVEVVTFVLYSDDVFAKFNEELQRLGLEREQE